MTTQVSPKADHTAKGKVLTYNPATNKNEFLEYTDRSIHTEHGKMYYVETKGGYNIKVTDDHSLATVGEDNFFMPLSPVDALGKFVPIMAHLDYSVSHKVELEAMEEGAIDIISGAKGFKDYMLELPIYLLAPMIMSNLHQDKETFSVSVNSMEELELAKLVFARLGTHIHIAGFKITLVQNDERLIPDGGKLKPAKEVFAENPANPYLRLPYAWDEVHLVLEVEREEITYDFTVPKFPLFVGNGILVYDTMQLHVPATEAARVEALDKMLPSKNLFSPRDMSPTMLPQQEHVWGLFLSSRDIKDFNNKTKFVSVTNPDAVLQDIKASKIKPNTPVTFKGQKTTAGVVVINNLLPLMLRNYTETWNKKYMTKILTHVGKNTPEKYSDVADGLKELGSLFAYKMGASYKGSDFDLPELKRARDTYFKKIEKELADIDKMKLSPKEEEAAKGKILRKAQDFASQLTANATGNTFHDLAYSGSKGSPSQVMQIITSPTVVADPRDKLIPMLIHRSYNEGLSPSDYWVSSYGTRKGTVGAKLSVAPAGALSKELVGNTLDIVISEKDCGTHRGIRIPIDDSQDIVNRVEAVTNKFIDATYYENLKRKGVKEVIIRSPSTCEAGQGCCQYCFGYNEKLKFPDIGENIGVVSTHAVTEPLTQMGLSSKHTAGTAAGDAVSFNTVKSFFNMSTKFSGSAVISEVSGEVTKIMPSPSGGTNVFIGRKKYYVPPARKIKVNIGDYVGAGDAITDGIINVSKVVPHKGIAEGRETFINNAAKLYAGAGVNSIKRNFEVIARGLINYVQIKDPMDFDEFIEGDVVEYNQLMAEIRKNPTKKPPTYVPFQKGTNKAPTFKKDWLANFGFKYLKGELIENAATNAKSPLHSYHPIGAYARGVSFGKGESGRY